jgi:glycosyltransferase involved in cell wall biosynthesis
MIWFLPLEPLHQRYTEQMLRWVEKALVDACLPHRIVLGGEGYDTITHGQWLDTSKTTIWKLNQIASLSKAIASGEVQRGDFILLGDVWMPGIEAIRFQSDLLGMNLKIGGWHYAGCFDHFDYLARTLGAWGPKYEAALLEGVLDSVCFGSPFHRAFVERHCRLPSHVFTGGLAWDHFEVAAHATGKKPQRKKKVVAFTHRWAEEKRPHEFCRIARAHRRGHKMSFVASTNGTPSPEMEAEAKWAGIKVVQHSSKSDYYCWLASDVDVVWSGADQETFGYSFMEAVALGKAVVAPNRACYPDHFRSVGIDPREWLYEAKDPCGVGTLSVTVAAPEPMPGIISRQYHGSQERYIRQFVEAFS